MSSLVSVTLSGCSAGAEPVDFVAIAAVVHGAPSASVSAAGVYVEPAASRPVALANVVEPLGGRESDERVGDTAGDQFQVRCCVPLDAPQFLACGKSVTGRRSTAMPIDQVDVIGRLGSREDSGQRPTQV